MDKLSQLSASDAKPQEVLKTAAALQTILLDKEENYGVEETPAQPEEPKIDHDKGWQVWQRLFVKQDQGTR